MNNDIYLHAKAVESAIMTSLANIYEQPDREDYWRAHADKLERKFTNEYGRHYSYFVYPQFNIQPA